MIHLVIHCLLCPHKIFVHISILCLQVVDLEQGFYFLTLDLVPSWNWCSLSLTDTGICHIMKLLSFWSRYFVHTWRRRRTWISTKSTSPESCALFPLVLFPSCVIWDKLLLRSLRPHHPQVRGILVGHSPGAGYTRQIKKLNLYLRTMKSMDEIVNAVWGLVSLPTATPTIQPTVKHGFAGDRVGIGRWRCLEWEIARKWSLSPIQINFNMYKIIFKWGKVRGRDYSDEWFSKQK